MNSAKINYNRGFTFIELIIVIAIMAITLGMAVPNFKSTIASGRVTSSVNDMVAALQLARSESIKHVDPSAGVSIHTDKTGNISPNKWIVFLRESTLPTSLPTAGNGTLIQSYSAAKGINLEVTSDEETVTYRGDGRLTSNAEIRMEFTATGSTSKRILTIQPSGRVNVCDPSIIDSPCYSG